MANRLRFRVAGAQGVGGEDEVLVQELTRVFLESGKSPCIQRAARLKRRKKGEHAVGNPSIRACVVKSGAKGRQLFQGAGLGPATGEPVLPEVEATLTNYAEELRVHRDAHEPRALHPEVQRHLRTVLRRSGSAPPGVEALPPFIGRGRKASAPVIASVARERISDWLQSDEGQAWSQQRRDLPGAQNEPMCWELRSHSVSQVGWNVPRCGSRGRP